jgi:hypothetical protein
MQLEPILQASRSDSSRQGQGGRSGTFNPSIPTTSRVEMINGTNCNNGHAHAQAGPSKQTRIDAIEDQIRLKDQEIIQFDAEIEMCRTQLQQLQQLRRDAEEQKSALVASVNQVRYGDRAGGASGSMHGKGKGRSSMGINYGEEEFDWDEQVMSVLKDTFGIREFRLCQRGCVVRSNFSLVPFIYIL